MPAIYSLFVINKSGGMIYQKDFVRSPGLEQIDTNVKMRLASIWHSINEVAAQLSPAPQCTGIEMLQADNFDVHCFQTLTGTKFMMVTENHTPDVGELLRTTIYGLYTDYVLKNPFYEVEMPIKCELFDTNLADVVKTLPQKLGTLPL